MLVFGKGYVVLSSLLFIIYMSRIDKLSRTNECVTTGKCKIRQLFFADDLVLLTSSKPGLQHASNGFVAECDVAEIKISTFRHRYSIFREILFNVLHNLVQYHRSSWRSSNDLETHSQVMEEKVKN